jgi:predicted P-loop ATPase
VDEELLAEIAKREAEEQATAANEAPKPNGKKKNGKSHVRIVEPGEGPPLFDDREPTWQDRLKRGKYGITKSIANIELILTEHEEWKDVLVYDSFACRTLAVKTDDGRVPPCTETGHWRDVDTTRVRVWLAQTYGFEVGGDLVDAVIESIAHKQRRHPVIEYLDGLEWDGVQRLPFFLSQYFGCPKTPYYQEIGKMWMISGVARVRQPGCQADYVLVLVSPEQGLRKSTAIRILGKGWGADTTVKIGEKDALLALQGVWVLELAELSSIRGAQDIDAVKAFITSRVDHFRAPFARRVQDWPRQCIFAGSVNEHECLNDPSGNRRFWPADCGQIDTDGLSEVVDQLWAEADARYQSKEPWYPTTRELHVALREVQDEHTHHDAWIGQVIKWLDDEYRTIKIDRDTSIPVDLKDGLTTADLLRGAIGVTTERLDRRGEMRVGKILRDLGYIRRLVRTGSQGNAGRLYKYFKDAQTSLPVTTSGNPVVTDEPASNKQLSLPSLPSLPSTSLRESKSCVVECRQNTTRNNSTNSQETGSDGSDISDGPYDLENSADIAPQLYTQTDDGPVLFDTCRTCGQSETFCFCSGGFSPKENHGPGRIES